MAITTKETSYNVRPDKHTTSDISGLNPKDGVVVFDETTNTNKYYNGTEWVSFPDSSTIVSGWGSYNDTQYPSGSPFSVTADTDTALPNNKGNVIESQKPSDVTTFYDGTVITGRNGDNLDIQIYFKATPSAQNQWLDVWIDIGGSVGELYRQTFSFPRGSGVERGIMYSLASAYTLNTWEANGGTIYVRSNASITLHSIVYNFDRSHKAI